jgi:carbonic anhydrase
MSRIVDEVIAANKKYVSTFGAKKDLALPPARGFAILTCMEARLDPLADTPNVILGADQPFLHPKRRREN